MQIKNISKTPIDASRLGVSKTVLPGAIVDIDDNLCLRSRATGWGNHEKATRKSILEMLMGEQMVPAFDEDRERYCSIRVEDLAEVKAKAQRERAEQNDNAEAGAHVGLGVFIRL